MSNTHKIQAEPICIYYDSIRKEHGCEVHFHKDYPSSTFDEFCLYVVIPRIKELQEDGYVVKWGYVNNSRETVEEFEGTMKIMIGL